MVELLVDFALRSDLSFDSHFVALTSIFIDYFSGDASKEVVDLGPLLAGDVELILNGIGIHDVC